MDNSSFYDEYGSVTLYCRHCKRSPQLLNGAGMLIPLETLIDNASPRIKQALLKTVKEHTINSVHHHYKIMECSSCNTLSSKFIIKLFDDRAKPVYESSFNCRKCSTSLIPASKPPESYYCSKCGQRNLEARYDEVLWD